MEESHTVVWGTWRKLIAEIIFDGAIKAANLAAKNISDSAESAKYKRFAGQVGELEEEANAGLSSLRRTEKRLARLKKIEEAIQKPHNTVRPPVQE